MAVDHNAEAAHMMISIVFAVVILLYAIFGGKKEE